MATIIIRHTHADGTLVEGMERGDGTYEIVCARGSGFRWFRSLGQPGIPQSRDRVAKRHLISAVAERLRAAGHEVTVDINDDHRPRADVIADQADRLEDRREALHAKAARKAAAAEACREASDRLVEHIPFGQPILVGHHSEGAHRRRLERAQNLMFKWVEGRAEAAEVARRAEAAGRDAALAEKPTAALRRIERLEAELRDIARKLEGHDRRFLNGAGEVVQVQRHAPAAPGSDYEASLTARRTQVLDQLEHDRATVARAVEAGALHMWGRDSVHVGDLVSTNTGSGARFREVLKVNRVSVSVPTGYSWTDKIRFTDLRQVRCPHASDSED